MPEPSWRSLYPFVSHYRSAGGHRYHYVDQGQGPPLLFVHGNPTWSFYFRNLIAGLCDQCRAVAVDHLGCGLSDKPTHYNYCLAQHIDNLVALIDELDLRDVTLVGHDWGGAIGLGAVVARRDRFSRLVLMNTAAFRSTRIPWRIAACRVPVLGRWAVQGLGAFSRAALGMAVAYPERLSSAIRAGYLAPYDSWAHRQAVYRFVEDIPLGPAHPSHGTLLAIEQQLPSLATLPVQLIWGMRDWCFTPWFLERFIEFFPAAQVLRLADAGHYVLEDAGPAVLAELRAFLNLDYS